MIEIPQIVGNVYFQQVILAGRKDWPDCFRENPAAIRNPCSFYCGLRMGAQIFGALRENDVTPSAE